MSEKYFQRIRGIKIVSLSLGIMIFGLFVVLSNIVYAEQAVVDKEAKTLDLLDRIDAFTEENEELKLDSAKAHYNMGNIYYNKGQYEIASREYYQAVTLMPDDPDSHYNLAYVSGENLGDYETALKHYKMYLYLSPRAKDVYVVKEKILEAELKLRTVIDSPLDR